MTNGERILVQAPGGGVPAHVRVGAAEVEDAKRRGLREVADRVPLGGFVIGDRVIGLEAVTLTAKGGDRDDDRC